MSVFRNNLKTESIRSLYSSLINGNKYLFLGKTTGWTTTPDDVLDTINEDISVKTNIISGYRLMGSEAEFVISRNAWSINTIYKEHSSSENLNNSEYSISVIQNSNIYIWVCINNNKNSKSTSTPSASGVSVNGKVSTIDGYTWQLVYVILSYESNPFVTDYYLPLVDTLGSFQVTNSSLTKIDVTGTEVFEWSINPGNTNINFKVLSDNTNNDTVYLDQPTNQHINSATDYYKNWLLILKKNTTVHVIKILSSSYTSNILTIQTCEDLPANIIGYSYSIVPGLKVNGDGTGLKIYPILNTDKKIIDIEIVDFGLNYKSLTINVENAEGIVTNYTVTARFNISGNMGYSILNTLKCSELMIYKKISASGLNAFSDKLLKPETGTLSSLGYTTNDIRQFGIISSETANPVVSGGSLPTSFRGYDVISATKATTSTLNITIDDYISTVDALGNLSAYGQIVSIAENPTDSTQVVFAVIPIYGTFNITYTQLLKLNTTSSTTTVLTPNTVITAVNLSEYTRLNGRILYLENILPSQITTNTSLNIRVLLSL